MDNKCIIFVNYNCYRALANSLLKDFNKNKKLTLNSTVNLQENVRLYEL